ncbi:hypothetical protein [Neorhodopirellula lusitana]|uniref:hypothetical protein n=1 Tax=Neorhodopirellula lusitana TaxID=445327 RepID=UPI00384D4999
MASSSVGTGFESNAAELVRFLLKLRIEGPVRRNLANIAGHLPRIQAIYVEVHKTNESLDRNSDDAIETILEDAGFTVEGEERAGVGCPNFLYQAL